ncbi:MAG TPA: aldo/keto reductase [Polyangia bacterium]|nr:aldo/keto reductase [Polyangia bacterium]
MTEPAPAQPDLAKTWIFKLGGELPVHRLGFGAMRITGPGIWGEPTDRAEAIRTLKRTRELGVDFIDTADSYGPDVSERLIREALHPYGDLRIATKAGLARTGPDRWVPLGRPEYLVQQAHKSLRNLGVDRLDLWQLHRIDPKVPRDEQFDAVKSLLDEGLIRYAGLSEAKVADIEAASKVFPVATVQNRYNLTERGSEEVLAHCTRHGIGFIPWFPLGAGTLTEAGAAIDKIARRHGATAAQIVLAWTLRRSPVMLPIPGTSRVDHLEENVAAARIVLAPAEVAALDDLPKAPAS